MPRYFFDVHDGVNSLDDEGTLLQDLREARAEAARMAGKLLVDDAEKFWAGEEWQIVVRDEGGLTVSTLVFSAVHASVEVIWSDPVGCWERARPARRAQERRGPNAPPSPTDQM